MALNSQRSFNSAIVGQPNVGADLNIFQVSSYPKFAVGTGFVRSDGNSYRYGYSGVGTVQGVFVAPTFASSGKTTISTSVIAPSAAVAVPADIILPGTAGSRYFQITVATVTANQFAGGYCLIEAGSGQGYTYRIKGNTATGTPATGNIQIELREPLQVTLSPNSNVIITPNPFNDIVIADTVTNNMVCGVSCSTTTTTNPYGWFLSSGQIGCLQQGTVSAGQAIGLSSSVNGAFNVFGTGGSTSTLLQGAESLGTCVQPGGNGAYGIININIING